MILNDLIEEYTQIDYYFEECEEYILCAKDLINTYYDQVFSYTKNYFVSSSGGKNTTLGDELTKAIASVYQNIKLLNAKIVNFSVMLGKISLYKFHNTMLKAEINKFVSMGYDSMGTIAEIILLDISGMPKGNLLKTLIVQLQELISIYNSILALYQHFSQCQSLLYEPLPESIETDEQYTDFTINSLVPSDNFSQVASSISCFGELYENMVRLLSIPTSERYYIRKIETGSLVITITGTSISLLALAKFIDFCFQKYIDYRKAGLEIKTMRQQIITTDLELAEKVMDLNPDLENKIELLEKASTSAFNYFKFNPKFKIANKEYDTGEGIPLIADSQSKSITSN